jgi:membrane fusion protein, multidrug efflux system
MRALETGVKPGELIVVNGLQRVRPGAPVTPNKLTTDPRGMPIEEKKGT